jgi:hypothetical protein
MVTQTVTGQGSGAQAICSETLPCVPDQSTTLLTAQTEG